MTDQHGYKIDESKWQALKLRVDTKSKRIFKLCTRLVKGDISYEELTKDERELIAQSGCFLSD